MMAKLDVEKIRKDFPILHTTSHGKPLVYLDSAATSQKPVQVIEAVSNYYKNYNANIHRGIYEISVKATEEYTKSKELTAKFINAESYRNIVYNRNTTEAINTVAMTWGDANIKKGDRILITPMEHHSNIVPWQLLAKKKGAILEYAPLDKENHFIDIEGLKEKLEENPKIVSFVHVSNVLGTINDVKRITELAHKAGAKVLIDGAQAVPHMKVDIKEINPDFYAFSSHKMLGPAGTGVLYGKEEILEEMPPFLGGGEMIRSVDFDASTWNELPWKFEAGTQNTESAIGFAAGINYLEKLGMENVRKHEEALVKYTLERLEEAKGVEVYGPGKKELDKKGGVVSFNIKGAHPHDVASIFDLQGIAIRAGHHCAMPLVTKILNEPAVARASFYIYTKEEEIDKMIDAISQVRKTLHLSN